MSGKAIVVLGGGTGGVIAANRMRQLLPAERIVLVEKNPLHAFAPSFLWVMTDHRKPEQITRPLRELVRTGVELLNAEVRSIDTKNRTVGTTEGVLAYDYLVIALGAEFNWEAIPGLASACTFYSFEGAKSLRDALRSFAGGSVAVVVGAVPYKCPGAPHEAAMLIADLFRKRGIGNRTAVHLFTPEPQPMPVAGPELGQAVQQMLESRGISFHPLHKLTKVDADSRLLFFESKDPIRYDLLVAIPPHRSPGVVRESGLANEAGWVTVDPATLAAREPNVYAIGDVTAIPIPGRWKPDVPMMLPKAGVFAHAQALVVAHQIAAHIAKSPCTETFCGEGFCMLEAGESLAGFAFGNFFGEPVPRVHLRKIGKAWHLGKILFEQWWLAPFGMKRKALETAIKLGARAYGVPIEL